MNLHRTDKAILTLTYCKEHNLKLFVERDEDEDKALLFVEYPKYGKIIIRNFISALDHTDLESILSKFYDCYMEAE